jgi:hypothetical protein
MGSSAKTEACEIEAGAAGEQGKADSIELEEGVGGTAEGLDQRVGVGPRCVVQALDTRLREERHGQPGVVEAVEGIGGCVGAGERCALPRRAGIENALVRQGARPRHQRWASGLGGSGYITRQVRKGATQQG